MKLTSQTLFPYKSTLLSILILCGFAQGLNAQATQPVTCQIVESAKFNAVITYFIEKEEGQFVTESSLYRDDMSMHYTFSMIMEEGEGPTWMHGVSIPLCEDQYFSFDANTDGVKEIAVMVSNEGDFGGGNVGGSDLLVLSKNGDGYKVISRLFLQQFLDSYKGYVNDFRVDQNLFCITTEDALSGSEPIIKDIKLAFKNGKWTKVSEQIKPVQTK